MSPNVQLLELLGPDQAEEWRLISHVTDTIRVDRETGGQKIFSILSIRYAYLVLRKILLDEILEDDPEVIPAEVTIRKKIRRPT